jgi:signal transduction histidine kinase
MVWIIGLLVVGLILVSFLLFRSQKELKGIKQDAELLTDKLDRFLLKPEKTDFSLKRNDFANLQNKVADLQDAYLHLQNTLADVTVENHDFIADISHQLKTPLAALSLYTELSDSAYREKQMVLIERMEVIIYQLLRIEKIRSDAYHLKYESRPIEDIVEAAWQELGPLYPENQLTIHGKAQLRVDSFWLQEAVQNILKNSCQQKSSNKNIDVFITDMEHGVILEIQDYAGGVKDIAPEYLFKRFTKRNDEYMEQADLKKINTGLGLAISKAIVNKHHGNIFAENRQGGLLVSIYLPKHSGYQAY